jgi:hypothetical protein
VSVVTDPPFDPASAPVEGFEVGDVVVGEVGDTDLEAGSGLLDPGSITDRKLKPSGTLEATTDVPEGLGAPVTVVIDDDSDLKRLTGGRGDEAGADDVSEVDVAALGHVKG